MESDARENLDAGDYESFISTTDAELLKSAWRNEKAAPEILKFEAALIQRSRQQIQLMEETVDEFNKNGVDPLTVSLYQMDLDRTLFLLRSYFRIRLQKIEKYVFHFQKTAELWNRLSKQEQKFAKRCAGDLKHHLEQSVLSKLPNQYRSHLRQSSVTEEDDMGLFNVTAWHAYVRVAKWVEIISDAEAHGFWTYQTFIVLKYFSPCWHMRNLSGLVCICATWNYYCPQKKEKASDIRDSTDQLFGLIEMLY